MTGGFILMLGVVAHLDFDFTGLLKSLLLNERDLMNRLSQDNWHVQHNSSSIDHVDA